MVAARTYAPIAPLSLAYLGLGTMGAPMAAHLARAGHRVSVYNRTAAKAQSWVAEHGGQAHDTPAQAVAGAQMVLACVGNDDDLRSIALGPTGALAHMAPGSIFIDHTTTSAVVAREIAAQAQSLGLHFIDAPVSGGNLGAINGALSVMCGADAEVFERARPVLEAYARTITRLGEVGAGQLAKMVNQIAVAGLLQGLAEALAFGEKAGLDMQAVLQVISQGAAGSWQMQHRGPTMVDDRFDFGFAVDWMRKDLGLCIDEAGRVGASLPVTTQVDRFYADVQRMGGGRWDTSSLIRRLR